jgi:uncharacterized RDD family membrane protein YckC
LDRLKLGIILNALAGVFLLAVSVIRPNTDRNWSTIYPLAIFFFVLAMFYYVRWRRGK